MWIFTNIGFFSVVQKPGEPHLTVRSRVKADLDSLRDRYLPELGATIATRQADYPYRAVVAHEHFGRALGSIASDLHYSNFKSEVAARQGWSRERVYARVWSVMQELARLDSKEPGAR